MPHDAGEEPHMGACLGVEVAAGNSHFLRPEPERDVLGGIKVRPLQPVVGEGDDAAILLAKLQHGGPLMHAAQPAEGAEVGRVEPLLGLLDGIEVTYSGD